MNNDGVTFSQVSQAVSIWLEGCETTGTTWYVSKAAQSGTNSGTSWVNAWKELDQINWNLVQTGDTIEIDGGSIECDWPVEITSTNTPKSMGGGIVD